MKKVFDVHSHLNPEDLGSKNLRGILGYHFLTSEVISCGCPIYKFKNLDDRKFMELLLPPVIQMIIGAHVSKVSSTNYIRIFDISNSDILYSYQKLFDIYNNLHFDILVSSSIRSRELDTIARMCPNVSLSGNWLHTMFYNQIKKIFSDRLEFIPYVKLSGFFSDAYSIEWLYGKLKILGKSLNYI
ncbi:MAG: hypothetical protein NC827_06475 [Candidatus Omnitrophica bacterium]|nr:hypothetical protein [Candidatus Omnitrophota bacterium]MCM8802935.1 hypothetical protein [Candidatus Omnitrophota bacterium]